MQLSITAAATAARVRHAAHRARRRPWTHQFLRGRESTQCGAHARRVSQGLSAQRLCGAAPRAPRARRSISVSNSARRVAVREKRTSSSGRHPYRPARGMHTLDDASCRLREGVAAATRPSRTFERGAAANGAAQDRRAGRMNPTAESLSGARAALAVRLRHPGANRATGSEHRPRRAQGYCYSSGPTRERSCDAYAAGEPAPPISCFGGARVASIVRAEAPGGTGTR